MSMARCLWLILALGGVAGAERALDDLFDPASGEFPLRPYSYREFARLSTRAQLRARGMDPDLYIRPQAHRDKIPQWRNVSTRLYRGFIYPQRLVAKIQAFETRAQSSEPARQVAMILRMEEKTPAEFAQKYAGLVGPHRGIAGQPLQALRHSERQFHTWLLAELARRVSTAAPRIREEALATLLRGVEHKDASVRMRCARVLKDVRIGSIAPDLERLAYLRRDPALTDLLVSARARHFDARLPEAMRRFATHPRTAFS